MLKPLWIYKIKNSIINLPIMKLSTYYLILIYCLFFSLEVQGQSDRQLSEQADGSGLSTTQLQHIDALCQSYQEQGLLPGGTVLVARHGKIAYFKAWGNKDLSNNTAFKKDDIFRLASMTKAFTSVAILQLYEQGKLGLDDPVSNYLPFMKEMSIMEQFNPADSSYTSKPAKTAITIRHLLTHTSGICYDFLNAEINAIYTKRGVNNYGLSHPVHTTRQMAENIAQQPLLHEPGAQWTYGYNMEILGYLIEVITGKNLGTYCKEHIFAPLGMDDTYFYLPKEKASRLVDVYQMTPEGLSTYEGAANVWYYPLLEDKDHFAGGGGASSTTLDYAVFCQMLLNGGIYNGIRILGSKTIELMTTDQLALLRIEPSGALAYTRSSFGLGFSLKLEKGKALSGGSSGTYAWGGLFNTKFWIDPKEDLIFVGMTQVLPGGDADFWKKMDAIIYGAVQD